MESFLYKDINKFLNNAEFESVGSANVISVCYYEAYDLLPFCKLLNNIREIRREATSKVRSTAAAI
jgi:hypothetical protein